MESITMKNIELYLKFISRDLHSLVFWASLFIRFINYLRK